MRLYRGKISVIAEEIVRELTNKEAGQENADIETEAPVEVQYDIEAVLKEYLRRERKILDEAKARLEIRGLPLLHPRTTLPDHQAIARFRNEVFEEVGQRRPERRGCGHRLAVRLVRVDRIRKQLAKACLDPPSPQPSPSAPAPARAAVPTFHRRLSHGSGEAAA